MRNLFLLIILVFVVAATLIFLFGDSGLTAYASLDRYRKGLEANVQSLQERNDELAAELAGLRDTSGDHAAVAARSIGLYEPGDRVIKLEGRPSRSTPYELGNLLRMKKTSDTRNAIFKSVALGVSVLLLAYAGLSMRHARRRVNGGQRG